MSVQLAVAENPMEDLLNALSPASDTLDSAFLGAMLLSPLLGDDRSLCDLLCADVTPGALSLLALDKESLLGASMARRLVGWIGRDPLRLADAVMRDGRPVDCAFDATVARTRQPIRARFARHRLGVLVTWSDAVSQTETSSRLKDAERRAEAAEARLVDSFIVSPDPFALFDRDDKLILCNEAWIEVFGLQEIDSVIGRGFDDLMDAAGRSESTPLRRDYARWRRETRISEQDDTYEIELPDGRSFHMRERRTREGGQVSIGSEVTEIIRQREVLHRALESINIRVAIFDPDDRLVVWNQAYAQLIGEDLLQQGITFEACARSVATKTDVVTTFDGREVDIDEQLELHRQKREELLFERWHDSGTVTLISETRTPDGWIIIAGTTITELKAKEAVLRARVAELDSARADAERHAADLAVVTEQLTLEKERAEAANRTKSRFLANMSHELRTPLNAILGFSEILKLQAFGPLGADRYREYAEDIHSSGGHLLSLINDILDMSKVEAGKYSLVIEEVSVGDVIDRAVRMMRGRATEGDLQLNVIPVDPALTLRIDPRAIKQVLINLLANAIKFTPAGGHVELSTAEEADAVAIIVRDTGIGIDPKEIPRLMRPFEQDRATGGQGTGLGLPLSSALVGLHGGRMTVESLPGAGTSVTIRLPRD
ncbi:PAS domain S-box-containing protein [Thalassobaculum litoreum DSM 18839]|uniref:histidine kinase n=2 Tax=Thalassobaculum TaxID=526215 RepID=A0A8G2BKZ7_9PROT|nr:PAS domain S-box-containing protein [Thalassobaculum litoreum DSM 18839]